MIAEAEHLPFTRTYRYTKKEDTPFQTKYTLVPNAVLSARENTHY